MSTAGPGDTSLTSAGPDGTTPSTTDHVTGGGTDSTSNTGMSTESGTDGESDADSDSDSDSDTGPSGQVCDGFKASTISWSLPSPSLPNAGEDLFERTTYDYWGACGDDSVYLRYFLMDLQGDGLADLVFTDACDEAGVGTDEWLVYENTGSGFANSPVSWSLPSPSLPNAGDDLFDRTTYDYWGACGDDSVYLRYYLMDLNGDGAVDLVFTDACDVAGVGTDEWLVYENTGSGFANSPVSWSLPSPSLPNAGDDLFDRTNYDYWGACGDDSVYLRYYLMDLNGDGGADLVFTDACDVAGVGTDEWLVYENTGSGFANNAVSWSLPSPSLPNAGDDLFDRTNYDYWGACGDDSVYLRYYLMDLHGDGGADLVFTDACDEAGVGTDEWLVYENTGSGFAGTPVSWPLPSPSLPNAGNDLFDRTNYDYWGACGDDSVYLRFGLMDLTSDGASDLVFTDACDVAGVGTDEWLVYENTGSGFANNTSSWSLPSPSLPNPESDLFDRTVYDYWGACGDDSQYLRFFTMDLSGAGAPGLLFTDACDEGGVGTSEWLIYEPDCEPL